jgi:hypothetical protein
VESTNSGQVGQAEEGKTPNFPIRLTWKTVGLVVLLFWCAHSLLPYLFRFFITWWYGGTIPFPNTSQPAVQVWASSRNTAKTLEVFHRHAVLIASMVMYFTVARCRGSAERRRARGEVFTGILNLQILASALVAVAVIPATDDANALVIGLLVLAHVAGTASWCLVGFHLCEGRIILPLGGILLPWLFSWVGFLFSMGGNYLQITVGTLVAGQAFSLGWQVITLVRKGSGFELYATGLVPAVRRRALVLLSVGACFWVLTPGFWDLAQTAVNAASSPVVSRKIPRFAEISFTQEGIVVAYIMPLIFFLWKGRAFNRRSRRWAVLVAVFCLFYRFGTNAGMLLINSRSMSTSSLWSGYRWFLVDTPLRTGLWGVFVPLCFLRWWVYGRLLRPLVVTLAVIGVGLIAVLSRPDLYGRTDIEFYLLQVAAALVFTFTLLVPDPVPREDTSTGTDTDLRDPVQGDGTRFR